MPFPIEPTYYNRYNRDMRYTEWRNLADSPVQSAEANEVQSMLKDLVQRLGDTVFQSGDVVAGLLATPVARDVTNTDLGTVDFRVQAGQLWVDGIVHDVEGGITGLPVPTTGWGFLGLYLRKELITDSSIPEGGMLRDPAVHDGNGKPMGLPGANRLKVIPTWVAGTLPVSDFDDIQIGSLTGIHNAGITAMDISSVYTPTVSSEGIFNARIRFPGTVDSTGTFVPMSITGMSQIQVRMDPKKSQINSLVVMGGPTLKASVLIRNAGAVSIKCALNLFSSSGQSKLLVPTEDIHIQTVANGNGTVNLTLPLTSELLRLSQGINLSGGSLAGDAAAVATLSTIAGSDGATMPKSGTYAFSVKRTGTTTSYVATLNGVAVTLTSPANGSHFTIDGGAAGKLVFTVVGTPLAAMAADSTLTGSFTLTAGDPSRTLGTDLYLGVIFETVSGSFDKAMEIFIADMHSELANELRRPPYRQFTTPTAVYSNYVVGPSGELRHGKSENTLSVSQPSSLDNLLVSSIPGLSSFPDSVIRDAVVTSNQNDQFREAYGFYKEDALLRVYPVHITYNGEIISTLTNREFTRLTDNYLSERLKNVTPSAAISGLSLISVDKSGGGYEPYTVGVLRGEAFINGRYFSIDQPPKIVLPQGLGTTVRPKTPEPLDFNDKIPTKYNSGDKITSYYGVRSGTFTSLTHIEARVLFKETVTHNQSSAEGDPVFNPSKFTSELPVSALDKLAVLSTTVLRVVGSNGFPYEDGLDYVVMDRQDASDGNKDVSIIAWRNVDADIAAGRIRRSLHPDIGTTFMVYYEARVPLVLDGSSPDVWPVVDSNYNIGFTIDSSAAVLDGKDVRLLKSFTDPAITSGLLSGPYLVGSLMAVGGSTNTGIKPTFRSQIEVYEYETVAQNAYIIYLSGNVAVDGPDGFFWYQPTSTDEAVQGAAKQTLLNQQKLPLGIVTVTGAGISPADIEQYDLRVITLAEQHKIQNAVNDMVKVLPALLSQAMLGGTLQPLGFGGLYEVADANYAEPKRINGFQWKIDAVAYPTLAGYTIQVDYGYFGDGATDLNLDGVTDLTGSIEITTDSNRGLLRNMSVVIRDNSSANSGAGVVVRRIITKISYEDGEMTGIEEIAGVMVNAE